MSRITASAAPTRLFFTAGGALIVGLALALGSGAMAASRKPPSTHAKKLPSKVSFIGSPSSESPAARKKRLKRECKGRPNAGACLGMTR